MTDSAPAPPGRIFISYRREETAYPAGWLFERLAERFGVSRIFKDVDSIQLGDDFVEAITTAVGSCDVLLALIGDEWLTMTDEHGRRRLDDPKDFVRLEIEAALARDVRVVPILVEGARMPRADELPPSLAMLARRQALDLSPSRFDFDTSRLFRVLDRTVGEAQARASSQPELADPTATEAAGAANPSPVGIRPATGAKWDQTPKDDDASGYVSVERQDANIAQRGGAPEPRLPSAGSPTPDGSPVVAGTAGDGEIPSAQGKPADKRRRHLSARARVLAATGVIIAVAGVVIAVVVVSSDEAPPAEAVVLSDDFSDQAAGWSDAQGDSSSGYYDNDTYHVHAEPRTGGGGEWSSPRNAGRLYPSAPANLRIDVEARKIAGAEQENGYGILCRVEGSNFYAFTAGENAISIEKYADHDPNYRQLKYEMPALDVNAKNHFQAACTSDDEDQSVHLVVSVNGLVVAEATDTDDPLSTGTVGIWAATAPGAQNATEAEFDNFVVTEI